MANPSRIEGDDLCPPPGRGQDRGPASVLGVIGEGRNDHAVLLALNLGFAVGGREELQEARDAIFRALEIAGKRPQPSGNSPLASAPAPAVPSSSQLNEMENKTASSSAETRASKLLEVPQASNATAPTTSPGTSEESKPGVSFKRLVWRKRCDNAKHAVIDMPPDAPDASPPPDAPASPAPPHGPDTWAARRLARRVEAECEETAAIRRPPSADFSGLHREEMIEVHAWMLCCVVLSFVAWFKAPQVPFGVVGVAATFSIIITGRSTFFKSRKALRNEAESDEREEKKWEEAEEKKTQKKTMGL